METYDSIIFDLDGTLWDASESCSKGWNVALGEYDMAEVNVTPEDIRSVSGLPFHECVSALFADIGEVYIQKLSHSIDLEERRHVTLLGGELYQDVMDGVAKLSKVMPIFLVSNCQAWYLESFWEHHKMRRFFKGYDCHGSSGVSKSEMIDRMCKKNLLNRPIYIGDTKGDQKSSKDVEVAFGFVEYGFGYANSPEQSFSSFSELTASFVEQSAPPNKPISSLATLQNRAK